MIANNWSKTWNWIKKIKHYDEGSISFKDTNFEISKELVQKRYLINLKSYQGSVQDFIAFLQHGELLKISCDLNEVKNNYCTFLKSYKGDKQSFLKLVGDGSALVDLVEKEEDKSELHRRFEYSLGDLSYTDFKKKYGLSFISQSESFFKIAKDSRTYKELKNKCLDEFVSYKGNVSGLDELANDCKKIFQMTTEDLLPYQVRRDVRNNVSYGDFRKNYLTDELCEKDYKHLSVINSISKKELTTQCLQNMRLETCSLNELETKYKHDIAFFDIAKENYVVHHDAVNVLNNQMTYEEFRNRYLDSKYLIENTYSSNNLIGGYDNKTSKMYTNLRQCCLEYIKKDKSSLEELVKTYKTDMTWWNISEHEIFDNNGGITYYFDGVVNEKMCYLEFHRKYLSLSLESLDEEAQGQLSSMDENSKKLLKAICLKHILEEKDSLGGIQFSYGNDIAFFNISKEEYETQCAVKDLLAGRMKYHSFSLYHLKDLQNNDKWLDKKSKESLKNKCLQYLQDKLINWDYTLSSMTKFQMFCLYHKTDMHYWGISEEDLSKK